MRPRLRGLRPDQARSLRRLLLCTLVVSAVAAAEAPHADAYVQEGLRWPTTTIRYHSLLPARYDWSLARAVESWNKSGSRVRFVRSSRARAGVLLRAENRGFGCSGYAMYGFLPGRKNVVRLGKNCDRFTGAEVLAHELGHVLGLGHEERRCALMSSIVKSKCDRPPDTFHWRCRLVERDDARGAVRRYGGRVRANLGPKFCWKYPPPKPPTQIQVTPNPPSGADATIKFRNPSAPLFNSVLVVRKFGSCATGTDDGDMDWVSGGAQNALNEIEDLAEQPLLPGSHCYSFWSYDQAGRAGPRGTAWIHGYQDLFPAPTGLSVQVQPEPGVTAHLQWTNNSSPIVDSAYIQRRPGPCGVQDYLDQFAGLGLAEAMPGQVGVFDDPNAAQAGVYCYAVWSTSFALAERHSRVPATAQVTIPSGPVPLGGAA